MDSEILSILACPKCKGEVTLTGDESGLICETCHVLFPIREGVPVMLFEEAQSIRGGKVDPGEAVYSGDGIVFTVVEGKGQGDKVEVMKGTCRALGRSLDESEKTQLISVDSTLALDEDSKKVAMRYVARQFQKGAGAKKETKGSIGSFMRGPDYLVKDGAVSRLHAMIFYDDSGEVGILDMVSKNGTYVNGVEIESKLLKPGDLVALGNTKLRFES